MRRLWVGGGGVALLIGLGLAAVATGEERGVPPRSAAAPRYTTWSIRPQSGRDDQPARSDPKHAGAAVKPGAKAANPETPAPAPKVRDTAARRQREEEAWHRRDAVCLKLMEIALETNDLELQRQAEQLSERVRTIYLERTANLPTGTAALDKQVLERHLATEARPDAPRPEQVRDRGSRASAGEGR